VNFRRARLLLAAAFVATAALAPRAEAANAVLSKNGTLYEVYETTYGQLGDWPNRPDAGAPVLALRTTPPDGSTPRVELVAGTNDFNGEIGEQIEFDEATQTVFVVYTRVRGFFTDVHLSIRRGGLWSEGSFLPNPGLTVSMNARLVVTRQNYADFDDAGNRVSRSRSILSIVWWEEGDNPQARYANVFIEDANFQLGSVVAYDLNTLSGGDGPTDSTGLPQSSYMFPAVQRDLGANGGVLVSFADLATRTQRVLRIAFPDDYTQPPATGTTATPRSGNSRSTPIGRGYTESNIPTQIDLPFTMPVFTLISPAGQPTYWWTTGSTLVYLRGDALGQPPVTIPLRPDFGIDRALAVVRDMSERE
jgi:hypothetical protein